MTTEPLESTLDCAEDASPVVGGLELSVVMPCLNEAETLKVCIEKSLRTMREHNIAGEVVIADNGSTDGSQEIARKAGARVVPVEAKGYGSALRGGIAAARGKYVIMGDADDSYDFAHIPRLLEKLREGYDLVMGNRFQGGIEPGAMPPLHYYVGNPVLSGIGRLFFHAPCGDFHCGLRGFRQDLVERLNLRTTGMEFASEMAVKATLHDVRITEVPTTLSPDGRTRAASAQLPGRLAAPAIHVALQPPLAVFLSRYDPFRGRSDRDGLAIARQSFYRQCGAGREHPAVCRGSRIDRLPISFVFRTDKGFRDHDWVDSRASNVGKLVPHREAGNRTDGGRTVNLGRIRGLRRGGITVGARIVR